MDTDELFWIIPDRRDVGVLCCKCYQNQADGGYNMRDYVSVEREHLDRDRILSCRGCMALTGNPLLPRTIERFFERIRDHKEKYIKQIQKLYKLEIERCPTCTLWCDATLRGACATCNVPVCMACGITCRCGKRQCGAHHTRCDYGQTMCDATCHKKYCHHSRRIHPEHIRRNGKPHYPFNNDAEEKLDNGGQV